MERSKKFLINTVLNYIFKFGSILINFFSVPIMLNLLGTERYGIWQTILTLITWASLVNFGIGNGLRNRITESIANNKEENVKYYISSGYYFLTKTSIFVTIILVFASIILKIDWVFKNANIDSIEIKLGMVIATVSFSVNLILGLVNSVLYGLQNSSLVTIGQFAEALFTFLGLRMMQKYNFVDTKIYIIAINYLIAASLANILLSIFVFGKYVEKPSKTNVNDNYGKDLQSIGIKFFVLQIATMFLYSVDNLLVSSLLGVEEVTSYSIASKLLMLVNTVYSILLVQLWNSSGDAYNRKDVLWISRAMMGLFIILFFMIIGIVFIILGFDQIINIWLDQSIFIEKTSLCLLGINVIIQMWSGIFVNIENGIGQVKPQFFSYIIAGVLNIPLSVYLVKSINMGLNGILISKMICLLIPAIVCSIHVKKILAN